MKTYIILTTVLLASALALQAQNNSYTGANAGQWNVSGNWSLGSVPTSAQDVFSANGTEVRIGSTTAAVAGNLTIGGASGTSIVSLRNDTSNSLTVSGNITLAPGAGIGVLRLGVGTPNFTSTLTIGGGSGSILDGGGAGATRIEVYGHMGTLGLANATADGLNINQNSSGSLTIGSGQTYTIGTTSVGSARIDVTDALTVNGTLVSTTINPGASSASGTNDATFTLNTGGLVQATTIRRSNSQNITFNWNGGTIQNKSGGNLTVDATSGTLTIGLSGTGTNTFDADSGRTITVASTAVLADQVGQNGTITKTGLGTLAIDSASTYTGTTTISAGTLLVSSTGSIASSGGFLVDTNGTLDVTASGLTVGSGKFVGGDGTINGNLTLAAGALFAFDTANTLTLNGTFSLDNTFGVASLRSITGSAIDWSTIGAGEYTLMNTSFVFNDTNIANFGFDNRATGLAGGREAYFRNGSLELVVIPEPSTWALLAGSLTLLTIFRRRRA